MVIFLRLAGALAPVAMPVAVGAVRAGLTITAPGGTDLGINRVGGRSVYRKGQHQGQGSENQSELE